MKAPPSTPAGNDAAPLAGSRAAAYRSRQRRERPTAPMQHTHTPVNTHSWTCALLPWTCELLLPATSSSAATPAWPMGLSETHVEGRTACSIRQKGIRTGQHENRAREREPQSSVAPVYGVWDQRLEQARRAPEDVTMSVAAGREPESAVISQSEGPWRTF